VGDYSDRHNWHDDWRLTPPSNRCYRDCQPEISVQYLLTHIKDNGETMNIRTDLITGLDADLLGAYVKLQHAECEEPTQARIRDIVGCGAHKAGSIQRGLSDAGVIVRGYKKNPDGRTGGRTTSFAA
jgi:hypothetical protein